MCVCFRFVEHNVVVVIRNMALATNGVLNTLGFKKVIMLNGSGLAVLTPLCEVLFKLVCVLIGLVYNHLWI